MPPIFKALASISAWVLFIAGWLMFLVPSVRLGILGGAFFAPAPLPLAVLVAYGLGVASFILAVCAMKLRQMLE